MPHFVVELESAAQADVAAMRAAALCGAECQPVLCIAGRRSFANSTNALTSFE